MKKLYLLLVCLLCSFVITGCSTIEPLDVINEYQIVISPRNDGTLDMQFSFTWQVLDDTKEGPLEWVQIGIPNYHVDEIQANTSNIAKIAYSSDEGAYIRIDFDRKYYAGETLNFAFTTHQSYMYTYDDEYCYFDYQPGWFPEIKVEKAVVLWEKSGVVNNNANATTSDDYLRWSYALDFDQTISINVQYSVDYFTELNKEQSYTDDYLTPSDMKAILFFVGGMILIIGFIVLISCLCADPYVQYRGFCGHRLHYYVGRNQVFYSYGYNRKGERIVNPQGSSAHGGVSGSCACACACAGGGRAGCSRKDFYHPHVAIDQLQKQLNKVNNHGKN